MGSVGASAYIDHNSESKGKLMGNLKTVLWIIIFGFVGLLFFQNQDVFLAKRTLRMDLYFVKYQTPELSDILCREVPSISFSSWYLPRRLGYANAPGR